MRVDVMLKLIHDGDDWVVSNDKYNVRGGSFEDLDLKLMTALRDSGEYQSGAKLTIFMGYDFDTFPTWLRQYHTHYFNRLLNIEL